MLTGFSGYYLTGYFENGKEFGYRILSDKRLSIRMVQGVSSVEKATVIEALGDENQFAERQTLVLANGRKVIVRTVNETPYAIDSSLYVITLEVVKS